MKGDERLFFIAATFGKYIEHYGSKKNYVLTHEDFNEDIMVSLQGELTDWFKQPPLTEEEVAYCLHYLHTVADRIFEMDDKEKNV